MKNTQNEPLLVQIPETGEYINVRPLITLLNKNSVTGIADGLQEITSDIDLRIRYLNINFVPVDKGMGLDFKDITDLYASLYNIKDMLSAISILKNTEA